MNFLHPEWLWVLAVPVLLVLVGVFLSLWRRRDGVAQMKVMTATAGGARVRLDARRRRGAEESPLFLWLASGLALVVVALARPCWGLRERVVFQQEQEILVALDLSASMDAEDVAPSRLERAKLLVAQMLDELKGEQVGLVVFAGTAFLQVPLSSDYEIFREFLPLLNTRYLPSVGTDYAAMVETALDAFGDSEADRFLIVLSDGEADPENPWKEEAGKLKKRGVRVLALGLGTEEGKMLPDGAGGFLKDERGAVVLSRLESGTLQALAEMTGGAYADSSQWTNLASLVREKMTLAEKGEFEEKDGVDLVERYQWFLAPGLLLLLAGLWREFPVRPRARRVRLPGTGTAGLLLLAGLFCVASKEMPGAVLGAEEMPPARVTARGLGELVGKLAGQDAMTEADAELLAKKTLAHGKALRREGRSVPPGMVRDALAALADCGQTLASERRQKMEAALQDLLQEPPAKEKQRSASPEGTGRENQPQDENAQSPEKQGEGEPSGNSSEEKQGGPSEENALPQQSGQKQSGQGGASQDQEGKGDSKEERTAEGEGVFQNGEKAFREMQKGQNAEEGETGRDGQTEEEKSGAGRRAQGGPMREVGGVAAEGTPLDENVDAALLVPLQRLDEVRKGDRPGVLFQRMQGPMKEPGGRKRNW